MHALNLGSQQSASHGIVVACDAQYYWGLRYLLNSLQVTNPNYPITVFDCGMTLEQHQTISELVDSIIKIDTSQYKLQDTDRLSSAVFATLFLSRCDYDYIMYLDSDLVVLDYLAPFYELCEKFGFVGVADFPPIDIASNIGSLEIQSEIGRDFPKLNFGRKAFNAGIFCVARQFWLPLVNATKLFLRWHSLLRTKDQAILNLAYEYLAHEDFQELGLFYNFRPWYTRAPHVQIDGLAQNCGVITGTYKNEYIKILHFIGDHKPWLPSFDHTLAAYKIWAQFSPSNLP